SGPLAGTAFGPGGVPYQFQYGSYRTSSTMSGGDPQGQYLSAFYNVSSPVIEKSALFDVTYDVTDNVKAYAKLMYGQTVTSEFMLPNYSLGAPLVPMTIQSGNPFIPASIQAAMTANRLTTLSIGRFNNDFDRVDLHTDDGLLQATVGAEGTFTLGTQWNW